MQAILTRYLGPTNYKPSRIVAECEGGRLIVSYGTQQSAKEEHCRAALLLAEKLDWNVKLESGALPGNKGWAHVITGRDRGE